MKSVIEKWKPIKGYEGLYEISNYGDIRSYTKRSNGKLLKPQISRKGYLTVMLYKDSVVKCLKIHRLVAQAFLPNPDNLPQINHKDENKRNNDVNNLEWCTNEYNHNYGSRNKRSGVNAGISNTNNPLTSKSIKQYTMNGEFVKEWESMAEAQRNGFFATCICDCCQGKR